MIEFRDNYILKNCIPHIRKDANKISLPLSVTVHNTLSNIHDYTQPRNTRSINRVAIPGETTRFKVSAVVSTPYFPHESIDTCEFRSREEILSDEAHQPSTFPSGKATLSGGREENIHVAFRQLNL